MASISVVEAILAGLESSRSWQEQLYRDVHRHPELSHQEQRTASLVADRLGGTVYGVEAGGGGTGSCGLLRSGQGQTSLLWADMDALPGREATGLPYAS